MKKINWIFLISGMIILIALLFTISSKNEKSNEIISGDPNDYYYQTYRNCIAQSDSTNQCNMIMGAIKEGGYKLKSDSNCPEEYIEARYPLTLVNKDLAYYWCKPYPNTIKAFANNILENYYGNLSNKFTFYDIWPGNNSYHLRYFFGPEENLSTEVDFSLDASGNIKGNTQNTLVNCQLAKTTCPPFKLSQVEIENKFNSLTFVTCSIKGSSLVRMNNPNYVGYALSKQYNCKDNCAVSATKGYDPECKTAYINPNTGDVIEQINP